MGDIGTGITIAFDSGFLAEIIDANWEGMERPVIDMAHMGTTAARPKVFGRLYDVGSCNVELLFDPTATPPIDSDAESITITFPDGTTWAFSGGLTEYGGAFPLEDRMTASCVLTAAGEITITPVA
jgi:hypothetical protein